MNPPGSSALVLLNLACALAACGGAPGLTTGAATDTSTGTDTTTGATTTAPGTDPTTSASASAPPTTTPTTGTTSVSPTDATTGTTTDATTGTSTDTSSTGSTTTPCTPGTCGDGVLDCDEACDDGPANNDLVQGACRTDCSAAGCGDSVVDYVLGEQCDDGDVATGDGCDDTCQVEAALSCGDGALDLDQGEQCDDNNQLDGDGCSATCHFEVVGLQCGDGAIDPLEVCDDGGLDNGDTCNPTCNLTNTTELFVGVPGVIGIADGVGPGALISGTGALTADQNYLYLADGGNNCVRRIDIETAAVQTIAGAMNGAAGYMDSPMGLGARFGGLESITTDGKTLWVSDSMSRRIRAISLTPPHAVTTVAGNGMLGLDDGIGDAATFDGNRGLTYYAGHVYMVDANGAVLRRFDPATQEVVTLAGQPYTTGTVDGVGMDARFDSPRYMTSDNSGILYIADTNGYHIRTYNTVTGYVGTFAGDGVQGHVDGVGTGASVHRPRGMASDGTSIYWVEFNQHTVRQGILATGAVSTNAGQHCGGMMCMGGYTEGVGTAAVFNGPYDLAFHFPSNSLFVLDSANRVIRRMR